MRVASNGLVFVRIDFLQLLHCLEAHRGCCIVETEHIRADVHEHRANHRVILRNLREESAEQGRNDFGKYLHRTGFFANFHDA